MKQGINFFVLLILTLFSLGPSPATAPLDGAELPADSCSALNQLFRDADITPYKTSKNPFDEFTYFVIPEELSDIKQGHPVDISDIAFVDRDWQGRYIVELSLIFRQTGGAAVGITFHCAKAKEETCDALFRKFLEIYKSKVGFSRCKGAWKGLTLEGTNGVLQFKGPELPQPFLLFDATWTQKELKSMKKAQAKRRWKGMKEDERHAVKVPKKYAEAVAAAYKKNKENVKRV